MEVIEANVVSLIHTLPDRLLVYIHSVILQLLHLNLPLNVVYVSQEYKTMFSWIIYIPQSKGPSKLNSTQADAKNKGFSNCYNQIFLFCQAYAHAAIL